MPNRARNLIDQIKAGTLDLSAIEKMSAEADQPVTVSNWKLCHNNLLRFIRGSCTLTAKTDIKIAEVVFVVSKSNFENLIFTTVVYSINAGTIDISADSDLYPADLGSTLMVAVFGWVQNMDNFKFVQTMPIGTC